jgi:DNA replication licensing factor MCM3
MTQYLVNSQLQDLVKDSLDTQGRNRVNINLDDLRRFNPKIAQFIQKKPAQAISMLEAKLNQLIKEMNDQEPRNEKMAAQTSSFPTKTQVHHINVIGNMGKNYITPRGLKAQYIGQLVKVQGIVTRLSMVQ